MAEIKCVCVFASSSDKIDLAHISFARELGEALARAGKSMVFGAGSMGLMGATADGLLACGGRMIGVLPELLNKPGIPHPGCAEIIVTPTMHERKQTMENLADAFIALPGGFGTLEELLEVLTLRQLGYHQKPVVICNPNGFYDALLTQFDKLFYDGFSHEAFRAMYHVAFTPQGAVDAACLSPALDLPDKMREARR